MAFAGEELHLVGNVEAGEQIIERVGMGDGDDGVLLAVEDEGRREDGGGGGGVGRGEPAGDLDDGADAMPVGEGGVGESQECSEGDAEQGDTARIDGGPGRDVGESVGDGVEPERDVEAVEDGCGVGAFGPGAIEVVDGVEGDAEAGEQWSEAIEPEGDVASGSVKQEDGGEWTGAIGFALVDADGDPAAQERLCGLHGG